MSDSASAPLHDAAWAWHGHAAAAERPRRVVTTCTAGFRDHLERLLISLERTNPEVEREVYVDDARAFRGLPVQAEVRELPEIATLGVKRARFWLYEAAIEDGPFVYLDADIVVLDDLGPLWQVTELAACPDDLSSSPYVADRRFPWPQDPSLEAHRYVNTGVLAFPESSRWFIRLARKRAADDAFWKRHVLPPWLHDNHVFCALLNLHEVELTALDAREFNWPGFHHRGRFQIRREGDALLNRETGRRLRLVHFAGIRPVDEFLDRAPLEVSSLIHQRSAQVRELRPAQALALLEASLSRDPMPPDWAQAAKVFERELRNVAGHLGPSSAPAAGGYVVDRQSVLSVAWSVPESSCRWNGLRCGGAHLEGEEYNYLDTLVARLGIESVLESGCGETTAFFQRKGLRNLAVEWQTGPWLERAKDAGGMHVPFADGHYDEAALREAVKSLEGRVDLVFIDSPVGTAARSEVLRQFLRHVRPRWVLYHDANRDAANVLRDAVDLRLQVVDRFGSQRGLVLLGWEPLAEQPSRSLPSPPASLACFRAPLSILARPPPAFQGAAFEVLVQIENRCGAVLSSRAPAGPVQLAYHLLAADGSTVEFDGKRTPLPFDVLAGHQAAVPLRGAAPARPGLYLLELSLVQEGVRWFHQAEPDSGVRVPLEVLRS